MSTFSSYSELFVQSHQF